MIFAMHDPLADLLGEWSRGLNTGSVLLRIALAVLLASVIGCERSSKRHSAGLRTFVLVSFASTVSMLLDVYLMSNFGARLPILSAATVIAAALVSGNAILFSSRSQIKGLTTSDETKDVILALTEKLGKTPVEVAEAPGFVVNRILIPMINEGIGILADGVADAKGIDTAMKLGANHPMGPLELGDLIGLDVVLAIMDVLYTEYGDSKYRAHVLLRKMVRAGKLGRKTGVGFYDYTKK